MTFRLTERITNAINCSICYEKGLLMQLIVAFAMIVLYTILVLKNKD